MAKKISFTGKSPGLRKKSIKRKQPIKDKETRKIKKIIEGKDIIIDGKEDTIYDLKRKSEKRGELIACLMFLFVAALFILPNLDKNVNEDKFCLNKLNNYFPEYDFYKADYCGSRGLPACGSDWAGTCKGFYKSINKTNIETRDGLREAPESTTKEKRFKLLNKEELDHLARDNWSNFRLIIGLILLAIAILMFLVWIDFLT